MTPLQPVTKAIAKDVSVTTKASAQVANTYELVENILLQLQKISPASVVKSQAVSKTFQHVLSRSQQLHLLRLPMATTQGSRSDDDCHFFRPLPGIFEEVQLLLDDPDVPDCEYELMAVVESAALASDKWGKGGSWRSWPVCRSNTTLLDVNVECQGEHNPSGLKSGGFRELRLSIRCEKGITLGHLADCAYELADLDGYAGDGMTIHFGIQVNQHGAPLDTDFFGLDRRSMDFDEAMARAWHTKKLKQGSI